MADMLATPDDLASLLKRDLDLASATLVLEASTAVVQAATGQRIVRVADDEVTLDLDHLDHGLHLYLPERPVVSVASVEVGGTAVTDYSAQLSRGRLWRASGWLSATQPYWNSPTQVAVIYTHGLLDSDQDIQFARAAALSLGAAAYENPTGATREQIDDYSVAYEAASARLEAAPTLAQALRHRYGRPGRSVKLVSAGGS